MESSISKSIARKLRQARKATGYTQEEVADKLGIARSAYGHIESGRNLISIEHLVKLPAILGVCITDILPDSVVTDHDRARAADPRLQEINAGWNDLPEFLKDVLTDAVRTAPREVKRQR